MYEDAWRKAFVKNGIKVIPFSWERSYRNLFTRAQVKYSIPFITLFKVNLMLFLRVKNEKPDLLIIWIGTQIFPITIKLIKTLNIKVISYVHDDPFSHKANHKLNSFYKYYWRLYLKCIKYYDLNLYSKQLNVDESYHYLSPKSEVFRQYYDPDFHKQINLDKNDFKKYNCEVAFAGHFENDGRLEFIKYLVDNGVKLNLYGDNSWDFVNFNKWPSNFKKFKRVSEIEYTKALNGAKICLCFMSKLNRDQYTTRCFEIPACGSILLAERTEELKKIFHEGVHALYFQSKEELLEQVNFLIFNEEIRNRIINNSLDRLKKNGDDVYSKINKLIRDLNKN